MAITKSQSLNGDFATSSTDFRDDMVSEINLKLNGNSVHGYPLRINKSFPLWPYVKFNSVTNRLMNVNCCQQMTLQSFKTNTFYAHKFEAEDTSQGWISVTLTLDNTAGYTEPHSLIIWSVQDVKLAIDKYGMVEKTVL